MKNELIKLAKDVGFVSKNHLVNLANDDYYYLWLCELQKWFRKEHKIHVEPTLNFTNDEYPMHFNCGVMSNIDSITDFTWFGCKSLYTFYKTYKDALEAGLFEALRLIKNEL